MMYGRPEREIARARSWSKAVQIFDLAALDAQSSWPMNGPPSPTNRPVRSRIGVRLYCSRLGILAQTEGR